MEFLGRDDAPFSDGFWAELDGLVTKTAKRTLVGRKFLPFEKTTGAGKQIVKVDTFGERDEILEDGFVKTTNRKFYEIPELYEDFWLYWRDIEADSENIDITAASAACQKLSLNEDKMIFYGIKELGLPGLLTIANSNKIKMTNWKEGENAFSDISQGVLKLKEKGRFGKYNLILGVEIYHDILRIQQSTGVLETERIEKLMGSKILVSTVLEKNVGILVCAEPQYMDMVVGQDIVTAYVEAAEMNHHFRILETAVLRIKAPDAIMVFKA